MLGHCVVVVVVCDWIRGMFTTMLHFLCISFPMFACSSPNGFFWPSMTLLLQSHSVLYTQNVVSHHLSDERCNCVGSRCCSKPYLSFSITGAFADVHVTHAVCTNAAQYHHRCRVVNCALTTKLDAPFVTQRKVSRFTSNISQTTGQFPTLPASI